MLGRHFKHLPAVYQLMRLSNVPKLRRIQHTVDVFCNMCYFRTIYLFVFLRNTLNTHQTDNGTV